MSKRDAKFGLNYFTGTVLPSRYACSCCGRDYREQGRSDQLDYLQSLQPGWLDGAGSAVSRVAIQTAESFLFMVFDAGLDRPGIFPTRDGGIQMEWAGVEDLEVVVSGGGQVRLFHDDLEEDGFHKPHLLRDWLTQHLDKADKTEQEQS